MALRTAILHHLRVPVQSPAVRESTGSQICLIRTFSSHNYQLCRQDVVDRVLDVFKSFPKVNPAKVTPKVHFQNDPGLDSLDTVEIVMAIEEECSRQPLSPDSAALSASRRWLGLVGKFSPKKLFADIKVDVKNQKIGIVKFSKIVQNTL